MSYLKKLRRLLPARKAWRVFTTKLQSKLHKLNQSKAIKKPKKKQLITTTPNTKATLWPLSLSFQSRFQRKRRSAHPLNTLRYKPRHRPQKKSAPVYIDQLFKDPVLALNQPLANTAAGAGKVLKKDKAIDHDQAAAAGTSERDGKSHTADDMWESLVLASPQMNGINERAEEFISRFHAEMQVQEMLDRHL